MAMTSIDKNIKEIVDFIKFHYKSVFPKQEKDLKKAIEGHINYGTYIVLKDDKGIAAVCRWNVKGTIAHVLDLIVRPDVQRKGLIKYVTALGWKKFPYLKWITFERELKYQGREIKYYPIKRLVGRI